MLSDAQIDRYSRQLILTEVGGRGQQAILSGRVAVFGADQAATATALYLAAAGVGTLHVSETAGQAATGLNPDVHLVDLGPVDRPDAIDALLGRCDVAICANVPPAVCLAVNAVAIRHAIPLVCAAADGAAAWVAVFAGHDRRSACFRCAVPDLPSSSEPTADGVAAVAAGLAGTLAATAATDVLLRGDAASVGRLTVHALCEATVRTVDVARNATCAACATERP
jgi:molybdopterin-synthase adenylyltransferase